MSRRSQVVQDRNIKIWETYKSLKLKNTKTLLELASQFNVSLATIRKVVEEKQETIPKRKKLKKYLDTFCQKLLITCGNLVFVGYPYFLETQRLDHTFEWISYWTRGPLGIEEKQVLNRLEFLQKGGSKLIKLKNYKTEVIETR